MFNINLDIDVENKELVENLYSQLSERGYIVDEKIVDKCVDVEFIKSEFENRSIKYEKFDNTTIGNLGYIVANCPDIEIKKIALEHLKNYVCSLEREPDIIVEQLDDGEVNIGILADSIFNNKEDDLDDKTYKELFESENFIRLTSSEVSSDYDENSSEENNSEESSSEEDDGEESSKEEDNSKESSGEEDNGEESSDEESSGEGDNGGILNYIFGGENSLNVEVDEVEDDFSFIKYSLYVAMGLSSIAVAYKMLYKK